MPQPLIAAMPRRLDLGGQWAIRLTAVDQTTGAAVSGVNVANVVITALTISGSVSPSVPDLPAQPALPTVGGVGSGPLTVTYTVSGTTLTISWPAVPSAAGYEFLIDGKRQGSTLNGATTSHAFAIPQDGLQHVYEVAELVVSDTGAVTYRAATPTPTPTPTPTGYGPAVPVTNAPTDRTTYTGGNFDLWYKQLPSLATGYLAQTATLGAAWKHSDGFPTGVHLRPLDMTKPQTLQGRLDVRGDLTGATLENLYLDDDVASTEPVSWAIGAPQFKLVHCTGTNGRRRIGLNLVWNSYGQAQGCVTDRCLLHDIGTPGDNHAQGYYDYGRGNLVTDTKIVRAAARGLQFRDGALSALATYCWIEDCGEGVIFGDSPDAAATNCRVTKSVLLNNTVTSRYLIETYDPYSLNVGNAVDDCYAWNDDGRLVVQPGLSGLTVTNLHHANPRGVTGYGPRYTPGVMAA